MSPEVQRGPKPPADNGTAATQPHKEILSRPVDASEILTAVLIDVVQDRQASRPRRRHLTLVVR